jgi:hypothetical protein
MSLHEFLKIEEKARTMLTEKSPCLAWEVVQSGAFDRLRDYAATRNYDLSLDDVVQIVWYELCCKEGISRLLH